MKPRALPTVRPLAVVLFAVAGWTIIAAVLYAIDVILR